MTLFVIIFALIAWILLGFIAAKLMEILTECEIEALDFSIVMLVAPLSTPILLLMTFFKMLYKFYMRIFHSGILENE